MSYRRVTHVIFDVDGLLLDTETLYMEAQRRVLSNYGVTPSFRVKQLTMGRSGPDVVKIILESYGLVGKLTVEDYVSQTSAILMELFKDTNIMPGAEKLVRHLHKHKVPMALCTGAHRQYYPIKTSKYVSLFSLFDPIVFASYDPDIKTGKPSPDCYLVTAQRFKPPAAPQNVLVFEDAPSGVQSAVNAQMQVVMVPDPRVDEEHRKSATLCLNSLEEFRPELFGLPKFE